MLDTAVLAAFLRITELVTSRDTCESLGLQRQDRRLQGFGSLLVGSQLAHEEITEWRRIEENVLELGQDSFRQTDG